MNSKRCIGINRKGERCLLNTKNENSYCLFHKNCLPNKELEKPEECPICLESMKDESSALKCGHWIHIHCIEQSLKVECPVCRFNLSEHLPKKIIEKINKHNIKHEEEVSEEVLLQYIRGYLEEYIGDANYELNDLVIGEDDTITLYVLLQ